MGARLGHVHSQCAARAMRNMQYACMAAEHRVPSRLNPLPCVLHVVPAYDLLTDPARAKTLWETPGEFGTGQDRAAVLVWPACVGQGCMARLSCSVSAASKRDAARFSTDPGMQAVSAHLSQADCKPCLSVWHHTEASEPGSAFTATFGTVQYGERCQLCPVALDTRVSSSTA